MSSKQIIAIDTNYWVRYLVNDNEIQAAIAKDLLSRGAKGEISLVTSWLVFFETKWVLDSVYDLSKGDIIDALELILEMRYIQILQKRLMIETVRLWKKSRLSMEDCFLLLEAKTEGAKGIASFDKKLVREFGKIRV